MTAPCPHHRSAAAIAWVGAASGVELAWAREALADLAAVHDYPAAADVDAIAPDAPWPAVVLLASDVPARWRLEDLTALARRWPLAPLVSVATSLADGRRRSGPPLPGTEEVPWSELPSRVAWWLAERAAGRPGSLGLPATARREDRALEAAAALRPLGRTLRVSVAAETPADVDGIGDLLAAAGHEVLRRTCGRPPLDEPADLLVWDAGSLGAAHLAWLRMLAANRPDLRVVIVDSFPRADTALAALRSGAAVVLGRPLAPESLAGALARPRGAGPTGLGPAGGGP